MNYLAMKKRALGGGWWADPSCVAAYLFKGVQTAEMALHDMTGGGHDLTAVGSPVWSAENGYQVSVKDKYLTNTDLNALDIKTVVVRYKTMDRSGAIVNFSNFHGVSGVNMVCGVLEYQYQMQGTWFNGEDYNFPAFITEQTNTAIKYRRATEINPLPAAGGVFSANASELRLNGEVIPSGEVTRAFDAIQIQNGEASVGCGTPNSLRPVNPVYVLAIAFYTAELSDSNQRIVAANMNRF